MGEEFEWRLSGSIRHEPEISLPLRGALLCSSILGTRPDREHAISTHVPDPFFRLAARRGGGGSCLLGYLPALPPPAAPPEAKCVRVLFFGKQQKKQASQQAGMEGTCSRYMYM